MGQQLVDRFNRVHDYLRISVTDRCNLRCMYCMPEEGLEFEPDGGLMSFGELAEIVRVLAGAGVKKLRLTGGEPLVRKDLDQLVGMLSVIPGIEDISLTTNGILFAPKAHVLRAAGLTRVNISLDSLRADRFAMITRGGELGKVKESIDAAFDAGLNPVKLNVVLMKGINEDEIGDFLKMTFERNVNIRFIEYMPIRRADSEWKAKYISLAAVSERVKEMGLMMVKAETIKGNGPAEYYRLDGALGTFGLIRPVSGHFCGSCSRLRLTADGSVKPCLYWPDELELRTRAGDGSALLDLVFRALESKRKKHEIALQASSRGRPPTVSARGMSQIGG